MRKKTILNLVIIIMVILPVYSMEWNSTTQGESKTPEHGQLVHFVTEDGTQFRREFLVDLEKIKYCTSMHGMVDAMKNFKENIMESSQSDYPIPLHDSITGEDFHAVLSLLDIFHEKRIKCVQEYFNGFLDDEMWEFIYEKIAKRSAKRHIASSINDGCFTQSQLIGLFNTADYLGCNFISKFACTKYAKSVVQSMLILLG